MDYLSRDELQLALLRLEFAEFTATAAALREIMNLIDVQALDATDLQRSKNRQLVDH